MSTPRSTRPFPAVRRLFLAGLMILLLSLGLRLAAWQQLGSKPQAMPDSSSYAHAAENLLSHHAFLDSRGNPDTNRTPGYPLLIAGSMAAGWGMTGVIVIQHLMALAMALMFGVAISSNYGRLAGLAGGGLTSLNILYVVYPSFILTEIFFAFLTTMSFLALARSLKASKESIRWVTLSAALGGCAVLVRPIGLLLFVPVTACLLLFKPKRRILHALVYLLVFSLAPAAWMVRNYNQINQFTLSDISSINLLGYQAAGTLAMKQGGEYASTLQEIKQHLLGQAQSKFEQQPSGRSHQSIEIIRREMGIAIIRDNPIPFLKHTGRNVAIILLGNGSTHISRMTGMSQSAARTTCLLFSIPALLMALYGLMRCWLKDAPQAILTLVYIVYFVGIAALGGVGGSRFRIPVEPLFCMLISLGLTDLAARFNLRKS